MRKTTEQTANQRKGGHRTARCVLLFAAALVAVGLAATAQARLHAVSDERVEVVTPSGTFEFPLWYQDANGLKLQLCLDPELCLAAFEGEEDEDGNPVLDTEILYYLAEAQLTFDAQPGAGDAGRARLIQALEAFVDDDPDLGLIHGVFNAFIINGRGFTPLAIYTFATPHGTFAIQADDRGRLGFELPELHPEGDAEELFAIALEGPIQKFAYWDADLPVVDGPDRYIGDPATPHAIFGSPSGANFFRITGPDNFDVSTDLFTVVGQVYTGDAPVAPVASFDLEATKPGEPIVVDVLANDIPSAPTPGVPTGPGYMPINPTTIVYAAPEGATVVEDRLNDRVRLRFQSEAAGAYRFAYTVQNFVGQTSQPAAVTVAVEDLQVGAAEVRTKLLKWHVQGTSSDTGLRAGLDGAQEVPPVVTAATGAATFVLNAEATEIAFALDVAGLSGAVTAAHIHLGAPGVNGGILFPLAVGPGADFTGGTGSGGHVGTLTSADFTPTGDVATFEQALEAILAGRTYVNVHTAANPPGEIRGQIGPNSISVHAGSDLAQPLVGTAPVGLDGRWSLDGGALIAPASSAAVSVESSNGISVLNQALDVR